MKKFIVTSEEEMQERGWNKLDFVFISGDAYVDHPSFGPAIICRVLEERGYKVGIIAQPDWHNIDNFKVLGKPRLGVLISAGNLDSMLNKLTSAKKYRSKDLYSPGGKTGMRPDRATIIYGNAVRSLWKDVPVVIGGIEASLRRFVHYDYWSDSLRNSIAIDSRADILVYGMGERQIVEIADRLGNGELINTINDVQGTSYVVKDANGGDFGDERYKSLPSYEEIKNDRFKFALAFKTAYEEQDPYNGKALFQRSGDYAVVHNRPALPLTETEMDKVYDLPFTRMYHPRYNEIGGIPALEEIKFSIVSHRGCVGGCAFCALHFHQGRIMQRRTQNSIIAEAKSISSFSDFKGYIHDVGGPTANFRNANCKLLKKGSACKNKQCMFPVVCKNLETSHEEYLNLLKKVRMLPGIKKVFIRSGLRYDFLLEDMKRNKSDEFIYEICRNHISGQLKIAPEHVNQRVTALMMKSSKKVYVQFAALFKKINEEIGKKQYLVPYFMTGHPGCGLADAIELAEFVRNMNYNPEQVQDFIPTPGTMSTAMYYSGVHPLTGDKVHTVKSVKEKYKQKALLQYRNPKNYQMVYEALTEGGRADLIGMAAKCLLRPQRVLKKAYEINRNRFKKSKR